jgi:hypothetical protein
MALSSKLREMDLAKDMTTTTFLAAIFGAVCNPPAYPGLAW